MAVSRPDDFTFKSFYSSVETTTTTTNKTNQIDLSVDDLDSVPRQSLLVQRKNVQVQRRRVASRNPIKALATRTDITNEYTEVITGVAERERKRLNIEKRKYIFRNCLLNFTLTGFFYSPPCSRGNGVGVL